MDSQGYLYLKGRKKNLIVLSNGMNVYPEDIENVLLTNSAVKDAVIVGLNEGDGGPAVHGILLMDDASQAKAVIQQTNKQLASHQQIRGFTIWPDADFPRTHTLKVKRPEVTGKAADVARATNTMKQAMLYLVATPIGNLDDITLRALTTLRQVDYVASEDTRKTGLLLKHFDITRPQISFHEHNEERAGQRIEELLKQGKSVALVTDAGTPGIADPGYTLVRRAVAAGIPVTMIPGPTAFAMALVLSGLPVHSFTFRGFPPRKAGPRRRFLAIDQDAPHTLVYYESPYRLQAFLHDALEVFSE